MFGDDPDRSAQPPVMLGAAIRAAVADRIGEGCTPGDHEQRRRVADRRHDPAAECGDPARERTVAWLAVDRDPLADERPGRCSAWGRAGLARRRQPLVECDAGMIDRLDDNPAGRARVAQRIVMLVRDPEMLREKA